MVIDIKENKLSIDEIFNILNSEVSELCHEACMSALLLKYNYLQENGVIMEAEEEKKSIGQIIKNLFDTIVEKAKKFISTCKKKIHDKIQSIKDKINESKAKKAEKEFEYYADEALKRFNDLEKYSNDYSRVQDAANVMNNTYKDFTSDCKKKCDSIIIKLTSDQYREIN